MGDCFDSKGKDQDLRGSLVLKNYKNLEDSLSWKLALGTVQFGLDYGVSNTTGKVSKDEVHAILQHALDSGISSLDTAAEYGDSESVLGSFGLADWTIGTKLPRYDRGTTCSQVIGAVENSLQNLNLESVDTVLLHDSSVLFQEQADEILKGLIACQKRGLIKRMGVSVYDPSEIEAVLSVFRPDIIQAPVNLLDNRLLESKLISNLCFDGIEVHARSVFLQGLLLMEPTLRPKFFHRFSELLKDWDEYVVYSGRSRLVNSLLPILESPYITKIIVGVQSVSELKQILDAASTSLDSVWRPAMSPPRELIDPRTWPI